MKLKTKATCPMCGATMEFNWETTELPYFGDALIIAGVCECGFRHSDTMLLSQREPYRHTLVVREIEDLNARVLRSSSGTIHIPEIGVDIEPGYASEAYITNIEGVLVRVKGIVEFATNAARQAQDAERTAKGEEILSKIEMALRGEFSLTVILEDPFGNSAIISEHAVATPLSIEEASTLKTGMIVLDLSE